MYGWELQKYKYLVTNRLLRADGGDNGRAYL